MRVMMVTVMMSAMTNVLAFSDITITLGFKKKNPLSFSSVSYGFTPSTAEQNDIIILLCHMFVNMLKAFFL